jgi:hypothetical protein
MSVEMGGDRIERAARNQSLFREVNERLQDLAETFQSVSETNVFACECAAMSCIEPIQLSVDEYEAIRKHPNQFAVLPGHVYPDVEDVLSENERYVVVAKIGEGGEIAQRLYPRASGDERNDSAERLG